MRSVGGLVCLSTFLGVAMALRGVVDLARLAGPFSPPPDLLSTLPELLRS